MKDDSVEKLAWLLDEAFPIPGTKYRVGWDAIIGLVPGIGETLTLFAQAGVVLLAVGRYDVPLVVALRMVWNIFIDGVVGSIPFFGDIFDAFYKANTRNVKLLRDARAEKTSGKVSQRRHGVYFAFIAFVILVVVGLIMTLVVFVLRTLLGLLG